MTIVPRPAYPVAIWEEPPITAAPAASITLLVPFKTTAGYWVLRTPGNGPVGSTQGAAIHGAYDTLTTSTTVGLRHVRGPSGFVFSY